MPQHSETDRRYHSGRIKKMLSEAMSHAREDVGKVNDPKAQALFERTAEVASRYHNSGPLRRP